MDNLLTIIVALLAAAAVGFIVYQVTRNSGSKPSSGTTRPGKPNPFDTDVR